MDRALDAMDSQDRRPVDMQIGDWSVKEAAVLMGVSEKTVRRHVKDNVLPSRRQPGKYGEELRVTAIPESMVRPHAQSSQHAPVEESSATAHGPAAATDGSASPRGDGTAGEFGLKSLLEQRDRQVAELNQMLGAARLRISQLEAQVNLLEAHTSRKPWWRNVWHRLTGGSNRP